jgi:hypothetical protein
MKSVLDIRKGVISGNRREAKVVIRAAKQIRKKKEGKR